MFDHTLRVRVGIHYTGEKYGIVLYTSSRRLKIKVRDSYELADWIEGIADSIAKSPYCKKNRFSSFSPIRSKNWCKAYINAHEYYKDLALDLEKAKSEIYITDWWLSPEVYLVRPIKRVKITLPDGSEEYRLDTKWRLDQILKRRAEAGVKIFILLYREFEQALPNKSAYSQQVLQNMIEDNDNIEIIRHPGNLIFLWSHHEKTVTIDQKICYMGGLDLCYGRFDLDNYPLSDPGDDEQGIYFPGQDYSNVRIKDFENVDQHEMCLIDPNTQPRMPWRDIAIKLKGMITKDITRHFIQYWNFAKSDIEGKKRKNFLQKKYFKKSKKKENGSSVKKTTSISNSKEKDEAEISEEEDDESVGRVESFQKVSVTDSNLSMKGNSPNIYKKRKDSILDAISQKGKNLLGVSKMPGRVRQGEGELIAPDDMTYEDYLQSKNKHIILKGAMLPENAKLDNQDFNKQQGESQRNSRTLSINLKNGKKLLKGLFKKKKPNKLPGNLYSQEMIQSSSVGLRRQTMNFREFTSECQILRSAGHWSIGLKANQTEKSIQLAYIELITNAEKFIYIENQFFVSDVEKGPVSNKIASAISERIERAIDEGKDFKVCVLLPLLPGFEGGIEAKSGNVMRIQLGWEYQTINRGKNSIISR